MSTFNVPEQTLEPKESPDMELITNINNECEKLTYNIKKMEEEYEEVMIALRDVKFLDFDIKAKVFESYEEKMEHDKDDLRSMQVRLEELGAF